MHNQVWMIEFSYECDSILHNAWLDIPYVFLLFIEMISDKHTWRRLIQFTCQWELVVRWAGLFLVLSLDPGDEDMDNFMFFFHQPLLISLDSWLMNWCSLEMQLKFFLDCLTAWWKVLLLCLLAIHQSSWRSKNELHWCLRESFISNDLEMSFVWPWSLLDLWDTISSEPLIDDVCWHDNVRHGVVASRCLVLIDGV